MNVFMVLATLVIVALTGLVFYRSIPSLEPVPERSTKRQLPRPETLSVSELPLLKNTVTIASQRWKTGPEPLPDEVLINAPAASPELKLAGTLSSNDCRYAIAIIAIDNIQHSYGCNDIIDHDNEKVIKIFPGKIVIDNNGYYETIKINDK
ncbi:type II secretion system protein N [Kalamiella sp. sgz302252]|uniref:type II secretion system protein N n=1 Tax=Pantoea sp. sgz302252 TaxID=3341827 RepID=UPI0036D3CD53